MFAKMEIKLFMTSAGIRIHARLYEYDICVFSKLKSDVKYIVVCLKETNQKDHFIQLLSCKTTNRNEVCWI